MVEGLKNLLKSGIDLIEKLVSLIGSTVVEFSSISTSNAVVGTINDVLVLFGVSLVVLFFMMDFMTKAMNPDWLTMPNILLFLMKGVIFKSFITTSKSLMDGIEDISKQIFNKVSIAGIDFSGDYGMNVIKNNIDSLSNKNKDIFQHLFYGLVIIFVIGVLLFALVTLFVSLTAIILEIQLYKCIAPIPLATLVSAQNNIGFRFIQNFVAVCLQNTILYLSVLLVRGLVVTITNAEVFSFGGTNIVGFLVAMICLSTSIKNSSAISKAILGV